MTRRRYLITPPAGFCAPFVVWAHGRLNALCNADDWLGVFMPDETTATLYLFDHQEQP